jgi:carbamate kinase
MKIVVALGGNALLQRGQAQDAATQWENVQRAAKQIARIARTQPAHQLVVAHGNGPQVGLLALQAAAYKDVTAYPLDILGAESEGMVGYMLEQALSNLLNTQATPAPAKLRVVATLFTRTEVSLDDAAFLRPTKPIGPVYSALDAARIGQERGWTMAGDGTGQGAGMRRVVASPAPLRILSLQAIEWLLAHGALVIAAGGGGVPVAQRQGSNDGALYGVEAVIDKDACSSLLARELQADCLLIATDVPALYADWGLPSQRALGRTTTAVLAAMQFTPGSMAPKVQAACDFVNATGMRAVIGALDDIEGLLVGSHGTQIVSDQ